MQGNCQINANEREDSEVVNEWEEQVRRERADREGEAEKASGSGEGHRVQGREKEKVRENREGAEGESSDPPGDDEDEGKMLATLDI